MKPLKLIFVVVFLIPLESNAQDQQKYQCTLGDMTRRVEIVSEPGVAVPCEVHYFKDTEAPGEQQVLWRALNQEGFCESKTTEFVASLGEMGWNCGSASSMPEPVEEMQEPQQEPPQSDDTADLAPAEDIEIGDPP